MSMSTVKFHVASLMTKLGDRNRVEPAMWAYETNLVRQLRVYRSAWQRHDGPMAPTGIPTKDPGIDEGSVVSDVAIVRHFDPMLGRR